MGNQTRHDDDGASSDRAKEVGRKLNRPFLIPLAIPFVLALAVVVFARTSFLEDVKDRYYLKTASENNANGMKQGEQEGGDDFWTRHLGAEEVIPIKKRGKLHIDLDMPGKAAKRHKKGKKKKGEKKKESKKSRHQQGSTEQDVSAVEKDGKGLLWKSRQPTVSADMDVGEAGTNGDYGWADKKHEKEKGKAADPPKKKDKKKKTKKKKKSREGNGNGVAGTEVDKDAVEDATKTDLPPPPPKQDKKKKKKKGKSDKPKKKSGKHRSSAEG